LLKWWPNSFQKLDNTIIHIKTNEIAKKFGLTQGAFSKVLRPYVEKRKNLAVQQHEHVVIDDQQFVFDIAHLPEYVDQGFFSGMVSSRLRIP